MVQNAPKSHHTWKTPQRGANTGALVWGKVDKPWAERCSLQSRGSSSQEAMCGWDCLQHGWGHVQDVI